MRRSTIPVTLAAVLLGAALCAAAPDRTFPKVNVTDLKGAAVSSTALLSPDGLTVISFWATWCKPCMQELDNLTELYADWQKQTKVKVVAVSIDDSRGAARIPALVSGRGWPFAVVVDKGGELKRALGVNNVPHLFVVTPDGRIVHSRLSYSAGDENKLFALIKKEAAALAASPKPDSAK